MACAHFCDVVESPQVLDSTGKVETVEGLTERAVPMTLEKETKYGSVSKVDLD